MNNKINTRECPQCNKLLTYVNKYVFQKACIKNNICLSCSTKRQYLRNPDKNIGVNNGRYQFPLYEAMLKKYGKENADIKYNEWKIKKSEMCKGEKNKMFGKTPPKGCGRGFSGHYKNIFFRSSLELGFILDYENKYKILPKTADAKEFRIKYIFDNKTRTYVPDFYCEIHNIIYELKNSGMVNLEINLAKYKTAFKNYKNYKILTELDIANFGSYSSWPIKLFNLHQNCVIDLTPKSLIRIKKRLKII